jgi:tetratricopeptide (TPR) repeat protein
LTPEEHRALGVELYNRTWELLEGEAAPDAVVDTAHASAFHWSHAAGATAANRARSHWLCSHVYAALGRHEAALHHAERCLALVQGKPEEMEEFDLPSAYEGLARAHAAAGRSEEARRFVELGRAEAARIEDAEDREHLESQLASVLP